ncbi:uncharacterized protein LOC122043725 [Zingiber officinale]|nr:uncharacterized protein LOC122043725 [Zingiber officinale]KAG6524210.1 hypothetical protein ZIOFF_014102 [Zingiber officinale]
MEEVVAMAMTSPLGPAVPSSPAGASFRDLLPHFRYFYTSAPTSPAHAAGLYGWEATDAPTSPKPEEGDTDFAFYTQSEGEWPMQPFATADELFEEGMIRPLIPNPRYCASRPNLSSPGASIMIEASRRDRGRGKYSAPGGGGSGDAPLARGHRGSRSLSPTRRGEVFSPKSPDPSSALLKGGGGGSKKWKLKDLFLFRSASEGRATGRGSRDPLRRYSALPRGPAGNAPSPHEAYYSAHRAASEELKKKTPLPYRRQGLFSCLGLSPAVDGLKKGFSASFFSPK